MIYTRLLQWLTTSYPQMIIWNLPNHQVLFSSAILFCRFVFFERKFLMFQPVNFEYRISETAHYSLIHFNLDF